MSLGKFIFNKDENAHRYAVRGEKRERETQSETHSGNGNTQW